MNTRVLAAALWTYARLVRLYPPAFRGRFERELIQVFRGLCLDTCRQHGTAALLLLWLPALGDWAWTAAYQWITQHSHERTNPMSDALDRQLGDMIWSISCGMRAGYTLRQVIEALAVEAPEPAASAARRFLEALEGGGGFDAALRAWKAAVPSPALARLADLLAQQHQSGANLADLIDPLGEELLRERGSDPAFYEPMRRQAEILGAAVPNRANPG